MSVMTAIRQRMARVPDAIKAELVEIDRVAKQIVDEERADERRMNGRH